MKKIVLLLYLVLGTAAFGQFAKSDFYLGGQIRFEASPVYNEILEIVPHFGFLMMNNLSIGIASSYLNLFSAGGLPIFSIDPYCRYYFVNKKFGLFVLLGGKFIIGNDNYRNSPGHPFRPKVGLGFNYFITNDIIIDTSLDFYYFKQNSANIISEKLMTGFLIKF